MNNFAAAEAMAEAQEPQKEMDMTCYTPDRRHSTFDLPLEIANARLAALRSETRRSRLADDGPPTGPITRVRESLGRRLIELGSSILVERPALTR